MTAIVARVIAQLVEKAYGPLTELLEWTRRTLEEDNMAGPKETAARDALKAAIDATKEWREAEDENDASELNKLTSELNNLVPSNPSHLPVDQNGNPVDGTGADVGPTAPVTSAPETSGGDDGDNIDESEQRNL